MSFIILIGWAFSVLFSFLAFNRSSKLEREIDSLKSGMPCANNTDLSAKENTEA